MSAPLMVGYQAMRSHDEWELFLLGNVERVVHSWMCREVRRHVSNRKTAEYNNKHLLFSQPMKRTASLQPKWDEVHFMERVQIVMQIVIVGNPWLIYIGMRPIQHFAFCICQITLPLRRGH